MSEYYDAEAGAIVKCMVADMTALTVPGQPGLRDCSQCGARFGVRLGSTASALECPHCHRTLAMVSTIIDERTTTHTVNMTETELREAMRRTYAAEFSIATPAPLGDRFVTVREKYAKAGVPGTADAITGRALVEAVVAWLQSKNPKLDTGAATREALSDPELRAAWASVGGGH